MTIVARCSLQKLGRADGSAALKAMTAAREWLIDNPRRFTRRIDAVKIGTAQARLNQYLADIPRPITVASGVRK